jgi:hypothetical protein
MPQTAREQAQRWVEGYRQTALIAAAARSGLLDALWGRTLAAEQLAAERGWPVVTVRRLLRGLELLQVVERQPGEASPSPQFGLTLAGGLLCSDAPGPEHPYARLSAEQYVPAWMQLDAALTSTQTPFEIALGQPVWAHRRANPAAGAVFNEWLFRQSGRITDQLVAACEVGDSQVVADVGGGQGALLIDLLRAHPGLRGLLADQPAVAAAARDTITQAGLAERCDTRGIDFFEAVPTGCDLYLLKSVLHDWSDDDCVRILRSIRQALSATARLLVIERLVPDVPQHDPETVWLDLHMLCVTGGRERTREEYRGLLAAAGLSLRRVVETNGPFRVLEAGLPDGS